MFTSIGAITNTTAIVWGSICSNNLVIIINIMIIDISIINDISLGWYRDNDVFEFKSRSARDMLSMRLNIKWKPKYMLYAKFCFLSYQQ